MEPAIEFSSLVVEFLLARLILILLTGFFILFQLFEISPE